MPSVSNNTRLSPQLRLIATHDPSVRAVTLSLPDRALRCPLPIRPGEPRRPLEGWTVAVKDNIDLAGWPTSNGLDSHQSPAVPTSDSTGAARLLAAGAAIIAKTTLAGLALDAVTDSPRRGLCVNPWNTDHIAGGSSGGSAAAVAAGFCDAALGTDTGGSIRNPAAFCGLTGLRPTPGRIPTTGVATVSPIFDVIGPIARTASQVSTLLGVLEGRPRSAGPSPSLWGRRIGVPSAFFYEDLHSAVATAMDDMLDVLRSAGAVLVEIALRSAESAGRAMGVLINAHAATEHAELLCDGSTVLKEPVRHRLRAGLKISDETLTAAEAEATRWSGELTRTLSEVDCLLVPTTQAPAPPVDGDADARSSAQINRFLRPFSLARTPALTVPCGYVDTKLPIGAQLVARSFQDRHMSLRMVKGRCMARVAQRVDSVMSCRPVSRIAPIARLRRAAMMRGPDLVWTVELSSR
jgi:aspartyl-tRNA(Asn)/glutamyl-tRNA(Gln) amidotransferase subunit A